MYCIFSESDDLFFEFLSTFVFPIGVLCFSQKQRSAALRSLYRLTRSMHLTRCPSHEIRSVPCRCVYPGIDSSPGFVMLVYGRPGEKSRPVPIFRSRPARRDSCVPRIVRSPWRRSVALGGRRS